MTLAVRSARPHDALSVSLDTPRLRLRQLMVSDLNDYASLCEDAELMRYVGERGPLSREDAWRQLAMLLGHWALRGAALRIAFEVLGWSRTVSLIAPLNVGSIRLAQRLGERFERNLVVRGHEVGRYAVERKDWRMA